MAFSFIVAPFVLLGLSESFLVWQRVYYYAIIGTAVATAFFASPGKALLISKLKQRKGEGDLQRTNSNESIGGNDPVMGLPSDPSRDLDEAMVEWKTEMEARQRRGKLGSKTMPLPVGKTM